jgi:nitrogen regulatory protein PII
MRFKLIVVFVEDAKTDQVVAAAKEAGATGCTRIYSASGEGIENSKTFLGLTLETQRDVLLLLVEEHRARSILESIGGAGEFDESPGTGIAFQVDVEDAIGVAHQVASLTPSLLEEEDL